MGYIAELCPYANTGYHVSDVKINGTSIGIPESFATNITGTTSVDVSFAVSTCGFTINSGIHGSVSPGNQTVNWGNSLILTVSPEVGYHVADVIVNGSSVGALTSYSFSASGPTTIAATFAIDTFTITVIQGVMVLFLREQPMLTMVIVKVSL